MVFYMKAIPHIFLKHLQFRVPHCFALAAFFVLCLPVFAVSVGEAVVANAGNDTIVGLCFLHNLDASKSTGVINSYEWVILDDKEVNWLDPFQSICTFQAFSGGDYRFELIVNKGTPEEARDTVVYHVNPIVAEAGKNMDVGVCSVVEFNAELSTLGDAYAYEWRPAALLINSDQPNATFKPTVYDEGKLFTFYFVVADSFGCEKVDEIKIKVGREPVSDLSRTFAKLGCDSLLLDAGFSVGDDLAFNWFPSKSIKANSLAPFYASVSNEVAEAKLVIVDKYGCADSSSIDLSAEQFYVELGLDDSIGFCENYRIEAKGTLTGNDPVWSPEALVATPFNPSRINLRSRLWRENMSATDTSKVFPFALSITRSADGCVKSDTLNLTVFNSASKIFAGDDKDAGVCGTVLDGKVDATIINSVNWSSSVGIFNKVENAGKDTQLQPNIFFGDEYESQNLSFTLNGTDEFGCRVSDIVRISVDQRPLVTVSPLFYFPNGCDPVTILASTKRIDSLIWSPAIDLDDAHVENPLFMGDHDEVLTVRGFDKYGCEDSGEAHILWNPVVADAGDDVITKQYITTAVGSVASADDLSYQWKLLSGTGVSLNDTTKSICRFMSTREGDFELQLIVTDRMGCSQEDIVTIRVEFGKRRPIINDISIDPMNAIQGDSVSLFGDATSLDGYPLTYSWKLPTGDLLQDRIRTVVAETSGWLVFYADDGYDTAADSVYWTVMPEFPILAMNILSPLGDTVCAGETMRFNLEVEGEHQERIDFLWWTDNQEPQNIQSLSVDAGKSFTIYCKGFNSGYSLTDSFHVTVLKSEFVQLQDQVVCGNQDYVFIPEFKYDNNGYSVFRDGVFLENSLAPILHPEKDATYKIVTENNFGCIDSSLLNLNVYPYPVANPDSFVLNELEMTGQLDLAINDSAFNTHYRLLTNVMPEEAYLTGDGDFTFNADTTMIHGHREFRYEITSIFCPHLKDTTSVHVFLRNADGLGLIASNAFSPNGDNINDQYIIKGITEYSKNELYIYSKFGLLVYEAKPYLNNWDGKRNRGFGFGEEVPEGTYFYVLKVKDNVYLEGTIEIRR